MLYETKDETPYFSNIYDAMHLSFEHYYWTSPRRGYKTQRWEQQNSENKLKLDRSGAQCYRKQDCIEALYMIAVNLVIVFNQGQILYPFLTAIIYISFDWKLIKTDKYKQIDVFMYLIDMKIFVLLLIFSTFNQSFVNNKTIYLYLLYNIFSTQNTKEEINKSK